MWSAAAIDLVFLVGGILFARDTPTRHDVEPHRLMNRQHRWYLLAFDLTEDQWRVFRVDQMRPRPPDGPNFAPRDPPDHDLAAHVAHHFDQPVSRHTAAVTLHAAGPEAAG
jgi:predicted DNA-binding transcriptional regulator YafY